MCGCGSSSTDQEAEFAAAAKPLLSALPWAALPRGKRRTGGASPARFGAACWIRGVGRPVLTIHRELLRFARNDNFGCHCEERFSATKQSRAVIALNQHQEPPMRAQVLTAKRTLLVAADVPPPLPGPGQLLIAVRACAVCRTDLHVVDGELSEPKLPLIPGHEIIGTVVEPGADV